MWIRYENRDLAVLQLFCKYLELRGRGNEDQLRTQCEDAFDVRLESVADLLNVLSWFRIIAVGRVTNQPIAGVNRVNNLGKIWSQGDKPIDLRGDADRSAGFVRNLTRPNLDCCLRTLGFGRTGDNKNKRAAKQQARDYESFDFCKL